MTLTEGPYKILYCLEIFVTVFPPASFENLTLKIVPNLPPKKAFDHNFDAKVILNHIVHSGNKSYDQFQT